MRLIDADALPIKRLDPGKAVNSAFAVVWSGAAAIIEKAPTIDAAPVVRCRECLSCNDMDAIYGGHVPQREDV